MGLFMWVADMGPHTPPPVPKIISVVTSRGNNGTCVGNTCTVSANVTTLVTMSGANDASYTLKLYENGSQVTAGFGTAGGSYGKTYTNYAVAGGAPYVMPNLTYRVDIVQNSNSQVVATKTGNNYMDTFGTCGGPK